MAGYPLLPAVLPQYPARLAAGETHWAQCRPRECGCAPPSETLLTVRDASQLQGRASREGIGSLSGGNTTPSGNPAGVTGIGRGAGGVGGAA
jgi:hypothetical protein